MTQKQTFEGLSGDAISPQSAAAVWSACFHARARTAQIPSFYIVQPRRHQLGEVVASQSRELPHQDLVGRETATGPIPPALRPVFRDRDDFTAGRTLTGQTQMALDASAALIVICSPSSAKSHYVNEEITLFKSRHSERPVVPVIIEGKPENAERECFPPALKFEIDAKGRITKMRVEVLAADVREEGDGKTLALAKVVAGLLGLSPDDVFRRAEREKRKRLTRAVGALAVVVVSLVVLSAWAIVERNTARSERNRAEAVLENGRQAATDMVVDVVQRFKNSHGVSQSLVAAVLDDMVSLVDNLQTAGGDRPGLQQSKAIANIELSGALRAQRSFEKAQQSACWFKAPISLRPSVI